MSATPDRFPYPENLVIAVGPTEGDTDAVRHALTDAGLAADHIDILEGEEDARSLDVEGNHHGLHGKVVRTLQLAGDEDLADIRQHAELLRAGKRLVAVDVSNREEAADAARALRKVGAERPYFYAKRTITAL